MAKQTIIINELDNVAVALEDLHAGETHEGVELTEDITKGHKFALKDIDEGELIIKYGNPIACAYKKNRKGQPRPHAQRTDEPF